MDFNEYYIKEHEEHKKLMLTSFQTLLSFYRHLMLVASTFLGILIALHPSTATPLYTRLLFFLAVVALSLGILALCVVLHACSVLLQKFYQDHGTELQRAELERDIARYRSFDVSKEIKALLPISYACFIIALVLLVVYTALTLV